MIAEAFDTLFTLGWALLVWLVLLAAVASLALWTVAVTVAWACRAVWRGVAWAVAALRTRSTAPVGAERPASDSSPATTPRRRSAPSWAQPDDYEDAA